MPRRQFTRLTGGLPFPAPDGGKRAQPSRALAVSKTALSRAQSHSEDDHLISLFVWIRHWARHYPLLARAFHPENEGALVGERRTYTRKSDGVTYTYSPAGVKRRKKGVRAGVPDVLNLTPRRGFHSLAIELKVLDGEHSEEQRAEIAWMRSEGVCAHTCWCWSEAARLMLWYFQIEDRRAYQAAGRPEDYILPRYGGHDRRCGCGQVNLEQQLYGGS